MKKTLLLLVALITATIAFAQTEIDGIYYNLNNSNQTAEVTYQYQWSSDNYSGVTTITIPEKVTFNSTEYSVTSIGERAFSSCSSLTSITIPNSVTSIGDWAFASCSSLTSITIPNSVTSIGNSAFYNCSSLTSITIPNSVTSIGNSAFAHCSSLTSITIPNSVTSIEGGAFYGTPWLNNQPDGCIYINSLLYIYKGEMPENTHIDVKEGTTMICDYAFSSCLSLTSITIPNSVTSIGDGAFAGCTSLTSITIEATTPPTLNDGLGYSGMIYIPDNTLSAYKEAWGTDYNFANNENSLTIHVETPGTLSDKIFDAGQRPINVTKLTVTGTLNDDDFTCMRETMTSLIDVDLSGITNATGVNFRNKSNLVRILLPENLTSIGDEAFYDCSSLTSITIPNSVTSIGDGAFSYCSSLRSITIPNSVTSIGNQAFYYCSSLTSITIPNSVTSIGSSAFSYCSSLRSITIPNSVTSIGSSAFSYCSRSLTSITCLGSTPPEASDLGVNTSTCTLVVPKVAYNSYLRHAYWGQFLNIETIDVDYKKLTAIANNDEWGVVEGGGYYDNGDEATLTATANEGFRFVKWSDDVTDNPRTVVVAQDSTFTAIFEANSCTITTAVNDDTMGSVTEGGEYAYGTEITLTATANEGYRFTQWSDGNTDNPRIVTVTENKTYTAEFEVETFTITTAAAVPSMGGVKVTLTAEPIEGLVFDHWSDGNTENPRTLTLTEDIELYAYFKVGETNLETSKISSANIYTTNGTLHIEGATDGYHILDAAGRLIYSGNATTLTLPRGIYLITMGGEVEKIVL